MGLGSVQSRLLVELSGSPRALEPLCNLQYVLVGDVFRNRPIVTELGFDPVWFGIVVTINVEMGMITPPVGLNLFVLKGTVPNITMRDIVGGSLPFLVLLVLGLALIMIFPSLATWLPGKMGF